MRIYFLMRVNTKEQTNTVGICPRGSAVSGLMRMDNRKEENGGRKFIRRLSGGSFTVETALIMPIIIFTLVMSIYATVHMMNRSVLTLSCEEQAISGHEQEPQVLFAAGAVSWQRRDLENERNVAVTSGTMKYTGEQLFGISEAVSYDKVKPVSRMRKWQALRSTLADG